MEAPGSAAAATVKTSPSLFSVMPTQTFTADITHRWSERKRPNRTRSPRPDPRRRRLHAVVMRSQRLRRQPGRLRRRGRLYENSALWHVDAGPDHLGAANTGPPWLTPTGAGRSAPIADGGLRGSSTPCWGRGRPGGGGQRRCLAVPRRIPLRNRTSVRPSPDARGRGIAVTTSGGDNQDGCWAPYRRSVSQLQQTWEAQAVTRRMRLTTAGALVVGAALAAWLISQGDVEPRVWLAVVMLLAGAVWLIVRSLRRPRP